MGCRKYVILIPILKFLVSCFYAPLSVTEVNLFFFYRSLAFDIQPLFKCKGTFVGHQVTEIRTG